MEIEEFKSQFLNWEETNKIYDIKVNGFPIYTFIRMEVYESLLFKTDLNTVLKKREVKQVEKIKYLKILQSCFGFFVKQHKLIKSNWYITNTENKVKIGRLFFDNFFDRIISRDPKKACLLEFPNLINYHLNNINNKDISVKAGMLYLLERLFVKPIDKREFDTGINEFLKYYLQIYGEINGYNQRSKTDNKELKTRIKNNLTRINIYDKFIRIYKPSNIFLKSSYSPLMQIFVLISKKYNIKVTEIQHGHIYPYHIGYLLPKSKSIKKILFPDRIFVWSKYYKNILLKNDWKSNQIVVSGDFTYNEELALSQNDNLIEYDYITKNYDNIITIISQHTLCQEIIEYLTNIDKIPKSTAVIIKLHPKYQKIQLDKYNELIKHENVLLIVDGNIKTFLKISDLVVGVYSTSVIEALEINKEVHLINVKSSDFFSDLVKSNVLQKSNSIFDSYDMQNKTIKKTEVVFRDPFYLE